MIQWSQALVACGASGMFTAFLVCRKDRDEDEYWVGAAYGLSALSALGATWVAALLHLGMAFASSASCATAEAGRIGAVTTILATCLAVSLVTTLAVWGVVEREDEVWSD
jgi:hypothetical protein